MPSVRRAGPARCRRATDASQALCPRAAFRGARRRPALPGTSCDLQLVVGSFLDGFLVESSSGDRQGLDSYVLDGDSREGHQLDPNLRDGNLRDGNLRDGNLRDG